MGNEVDEQLKFEIRAIVAADTGAWIEMRTALWPDGAEDHAAEIAAYFDGTLDEPIAVLAAIDQSGKWLGLTELSIRLDLPELEGVEVGYIEGLYVVPEARWRGVARALYRRSQRWARERGLTAFASDRAERVVVDRRFSRG